MFDASDAPADSQLESGGSIPGSDHAPAFTLHGPQPCELPVLLAVPHAGRCYPAGLTGALRHDAAAMFKLEDRYADHLAMQVARESGARLIIAHAPRAMIDLNRADDDIDWEMVRRAPGAEKPAAALRPGRARSGLGLVPRRVPGLGEIWKGPLEQADLAARIAQVHAPWHGAIAQALADMRARWGAALLIDFHSMPPLAMPGGRRGAEVVIGDRFGATCDGRLTASAFAWLARHGRLAAHNRPYAGGHGIERHAAPRRAIHAIQIEIDRASYLDSRLDQPGQGLAPLAQVLAGLVRQLGREVADMAGAGDGESWPEAAE